MSASSRSNDLSRHLQASITDSMADGRIIRQFDIPEREDKFAIFDASYLTDILHFIGKWQSSRVVLVTSKGLYDSHKYVQRLEDQLDTKLVATKVGVGAHSPYKDVIEIAHLMQEHDADCLISIGSSSYSDAAKIASKLATTLPPGFGAEDMEGLIDQRKGAGITKAANAKVILVPTSLSASEWNATSSCTNADGKKQHFGKGSHRGGGADLILLDPELASTAPERLWLSSGVRCLDHCTETICNRDCTSEASKDAQDGLASMLKGLMEYKQGAGEDRQKLLQGISDCQKGSRQAIKALIVHRNTFGPSHAIGHQLGSVGGVMHGITSCIMLAPVLRYQAPDRKDAQATVLKVFNDTLDWQETDAADALTKFVKMLGLPTKLCEVGIVKEEQIDKIAEKTLTDVWGGGQPQITEKSEVMKILDMAR